MKKIFLIKTVLILLSIQLFSQTDKDFWFVIPEVTYGHSPYMGEPTYLHLTTLDAPSEIVISMPTNSAFTETRFTMEANSTQLIDLTWYIRDGYGTGPFNILEQVPDIGTPNEVNILESGLPTTTGLVENKGIHLTSTGLITAYLERNNRNNCDIWSLKGQNAKGTDFYVPGQNWMTNRALNPTAYNAIDIVATEDAWVYFNPTSEVMNFGLAGSTYSVFLERGQSICLRAAGIAVVDHLGGTHIWSDKAIVVSWKDDSVFGDNKCFDLMGDQMVPTDLAGNEYVVVRGNLSMAHEFVYIMSLEDGTDIICTKPDGTTLAPIILGAPGSIERVLLNNDYFSDPSPAPANSMDALHLQSGNGAPFIVYHVTGFGCESGASLLPPVNGCTGSNHVTFQRSTSESFFLNVFCEKSQINDFLITIDNVEYPIPINWFTEIAASGPDSDSDWWYLSKNYNEFTTAKGGIPAVPVGSPVKVSNLSGLFHLGIINGGSNSGCRYGYFTDFSPDYGSGYAGSTNTDYSKYCYGDTVQLQASGGINYLWEYRSIPHIDTTIIDATNISSPRINAPPGFHSYQVTITRACYAGPSPDTAITVSTYGYPNIVAAFDTVNTGPDNCSPFEMEFVNNSIIANNFEWTFERLTDTLKDITSAPDPVYYSNTSQSIKNFKVNLKASYSYNCPNTVSKSISVYPLIQASANEGNVIESQNEVSQTYSIDTAGAGPLTHIYWNWGDGQDSSLQISELVTPFEFTHTFINNTLNDTNYFVSLVFIDSVCNCRDTLDAPFMDTVFVPIYAQAEFNISNTSGCSPFTIELANTTTGNVSYEWWINETADFTGTPDRTDNFESISLLFENTELSIPKNYYIKLRVTHTNIDGSFYTDTYGPDTLTVYPEFTTTIVTTDTLVGYSELSIDFNQITAPDIPNMQYLWDFGNNNTSTDSDPGIENFSNNLVSEKNFEVSLISTSEYGCHDIASSKNVKVYHVEINIVDSLGHIACKNDSTGTINLELTGGILPYSFIWSDGEITQNRTQLKSGEYSVTVSDLNGCANTAIYTITEPDSVFEVLGLAENVKCKGDSTGAISVLASGGIQPYTYAWSNSFTSQNLSNLTTGNYKLTVSDFGGCLVDASFEIIEPASIVAVEASISNVKCWGGNTGAINLTVSGGIAPYAYIWSNGVASEGLNTLIAGNYNVTVTDSNSCEKSKEFTITQPADSISVIGLVTDADCNDDHSGKILLTVQGGIQPYTYIWDNGSIMRDIESISAGNYNVSVWDANQCETTWYTTVNQLGKSKLSGFAFYSDGTIDAEDASVYLYSRKSNPNNIVQKVRIAADGRFDFDEVPTGDYLAFVRLDNHARRKYHGVMSSYYTKTFNWYQAENISLNCDDSVFIELEMYENPASSNESGHCKLKGGIVYDYGSHMSVTPPGPNVSVILFDEIAQIPYSETTTDDNSVYVFDSIAEGSYSLIIDIPGITQITTHEIVIAAETNAYGNLDFEVDMVNFVINTSSSAVAIEQKPELKLVKIYPNPTKNELFVKVDPNVQDIIQIKLFTHTGNLVRVIDCSGRSNNSDIMQIDISGLSAGIYIIEIKGDKVLQTEKITIID